MPLIGEPNVLFIVIRRIFFRVSRFREDQSISYLWMSVYDYKGLDSFAVKTVRKW